jgi:hypothetical protein
MNGTATKLRLTYHGRERGRSFDIFINGTLLTHVALDGSRGDKFIEIDYPIPTELGKAPMMEVKFVASAKSSIANLYEVRLMKD